MHTIVARITTNVHLCVRIEHNMRLLYFVVSQCLHLLTFSNLLLHAFSLFFLSSDHFEYKYEYVFCYQLILIVILMNNLLTFNHSGTSLNIFLVQFCFPSLNRLVLFNISWMIKKKNEVHQLATVVSLDAVGLQQRRVGFVLLQGSISVQLLVKYHFVSIISESLTVDELQWVIVKNNTMEEKSCYFHSPNVVCRHFFSGQIAVISCCLFASMTTYTRLT